MVGIGTRVKTSEGAAIGEAGLDATKAAGSVMGEAGLEVAKGDAGLKLVDRLMGLLGWLRTGATVGRLIGLLGRLRTGAPGRVGKLMGLLGRLRTGATVGIGTETTGVEGLEVVATTGKDEIIPGEAGRGTATGRVGMLIGATSPVANTGDAARNGAGGEVGEVTLARGFPVI